MATRRPDKPDIAIDEKDESMAQSIYDDIADISRLMGSPNQTTSIVSQSSLGLESITGGVGTIGYRAPEQEAGNAKDSKVNASYNVQADMYSLGIILFEMFHPPFETYMERSETLAKLRGDSHKSKTDDSSFTNSEDDLTARQSRFPKSFIEATPENAQRVILWCLDRDPQNRPSSQELLKSELLPRKMEVEQRYLQEALQLLTNAQSEGYMQILESLFKRQTTDLIELTFDTDIAAKANSIGSSKKHKRALPPSEGLVEEIKELRVGAVGASLSMNNSSLLAATSALRRARNAGNIGKGVRGTMKRSTQRVAGILAMTAAASAAIEGNLDGVHGSDPRLVEDIKGRLISIFQSHGAVCLKSPLLRPRPNTKTKAIVSGPAELINPRGSVLLLPEDLTAPFARAVGRGGSATSNIKRYDVANVYHKSAVGGHPRESLEATFDIIQDDPRIKGHQLEAETLLTVCQVLNSFPSHNASSVGNLPFEAKSPMWYVRLTHTRLADSILELCGVPAKEPVRLLCLHMISELTSPLPKSFANIIPTIRRKRSNSRQINETREEVLEKFLEELSNSHDVDGIAIENLRNFVSNCKRLPTEANDAIRSISLAVSKLRPKGTNESDHRRLNREISKHLKSTQALIQTLYSIGVLTQDVTKTRRREGLNQPLFLSIDLGLRQRRKHFHGQVFFQCITIPDDFFDQLDDGQVSNDMLLSSGRGSKIAEGGRYDDLVRKSRPPGNFGSTLFHEYTAASIPKCVGVRFSVGKLVELAYLDAALSSTNSTTEGQLISDTTKFSLDKHGIDVLRTTLAHPFNLMQSSIKCIVTGVNALDGTDSFDRFLVASQLWAEGISAEYMAQSGVINSFIRENREELYGAGTSGWSVEDVCGVCAILKVRKM